MQNSIIRGITFGYAVLIGAIIFQNQPAQAGWSGLINGTGVGWASANVRSSTFKTNRVTTIKNLASPSAAMAPTTGFKTNAPLPSGSATNTYSRIKGLPGGIWQASANAANGDGTDNAELERRVAIDPADCAALTFDSKINQSQADFNTNGNTGTISVNASATYGTALWLRGFEYTGLMDDIPADNPDTVENESVEYLKLYATVKFETLILGPFEFGGNNNCPLIVPFSLNSGNLENLFIAADGVAKSNPLWLSQPGNVAVVCGDPVVYDTVSYSGCGEITIEFNPPPGSLFPVGVTPVVVTATDSFGNSKSSNFTVTVLDTTAPVVPVLPVLTNESSVQVPTPTATDSCGATTKTVTGTTTDPTFYNTQGTNTVRWSFDDGSGNVSTASQTVIIDDVTPPVPPTLPTVTGQCSVTLTVPTATDNVVAGPINGTTSSPLTITTQGTNIVTWTFNDGNGNSSSTTQKAIVKDTIAPVPPVLATVTGSCGASVTLAAPTAIDNCAGTVTGTTTTVFPITQPGTTVVTWRFSDGNGNISTTTQNVTVTSLTFKGFFSPVGTVNNLCTSPVVVNQGSVCPFKFDIFCGTTPLTTGQPPIVKIQLWTGCAPNGPIITKNAEYQNDWHYNWDTSGWAKGVYKIIVVLPDGTSRHVFVRLK